MLALAGFVGDVCGGDLMDNIGIRNPTFGQVVTALTGAFALGYIAGQDAAQQESWE